MRVLILGARGQLGHELCAALSRFAEVVPSTRDELDLSDADALATTLETTAPALVINAAAYNDVDGAEQDPDAARAVNADAVALLGERAQAQRFGLIHFSTDYVFDGVGRAVYRELDPPGPINAYGRSKLAGEQALKEMDAPALVLRTAWVYSLRRPCFVTFLLRAARQRATLRIVDEQVGNPTSSADLAHELARWLQTAQAAPFETCRDGRGVYHLAAPDHTSRYEWARAVLALDPARSEHRVRSVEPVPDAAFPTVARRPLRTALDCGLAEQRFGMGLPDWRTSLGRALSGQRRTV